MGYYIEVPINTGKTQQIVMIHNGEQISKPEKFSDIPKDKALIVICQNPNFEVAGFAYDEMEFEAFTHPTDTRPKEYVLIDRKLAEELTNFEEN